MLKWEIRSAGAPSMPCPVHVPPWAQGFEEHQLIPSLRDLASMAGDSRRSHDERIMILGAWLSEDHLSLPGSQDFRVRFPCSKRQGCKLSCSSWLSFLVLVVHVRAIAYPGACRTTLYGHQQSRIWRGKLVRSRQAALLESEGPIT